MDANSVSTPLDSNLKLTKNMEQADPKIVSLYQRAIGSLMYASMGTRPDITFSVQTLSQFSTNPSKEHFATVKRVLRYLKGTRNARLVYGGDGEWTSEFSAFADADWGTSSIDRKSISGYCFLLAGCAISWSSKKQQTVAISTTEAEYYAATHATKQIMWLRSFLADLGFPQPESSTLYLDNKSAIDLSHNPEFHARTKHIDIQHHFIREKIEDKILKVSHVPTKENTADIFTKALPRPQFEDFRDDLGLEVAD
jgi:hypothetical protein